MKGKKTVIIQARTGSKRLASKVLMNVENKPLICHVIDRIKKTSYGRLKGCCEKNC